MTATSTVLPTHLSIIITTSPIHSHPDTQLIDDSINSILIQPTLQYVHIYIVCDGAKVKTQNNYKSGTITEQSYKNYIMFKEALHKKYNDKNKYTIVERETKFGFAQNIKYIMEEFAKTEHVLIYQHDHVLEKIIDFAKVMQILQKNVNQINYLTFMHKSYNTLIERQLQYPKVKAFVLKLLQKKEDYNYYLNKQDFKESLLRFFQAQFELPLVPLNFWYDKVHIAKRQYYLNIIFNQEGNFDYHKNKYMKTISFVEDTFGHCMKSTIAEFPQKLFEYGAYVFWDVEPVFYHQSGRPFITKQQRESYQRKGKKVVQQLDQKEQFQGIDLDEISEIKMNPL